MTIFAFILTLILAVGVALAYELLKMSGVPRASSDAASLHRALQRLAAYEPMRRLFATEDYDGFGSRPDLAARLLKSRRKAMRLYLRRLRADFMLVWSTCRLLAPVSNDPDFVFQLMRQLFVFHGLLAVLETRCLFGCWASVDVDLGRMADSLAGLHGQASNLLQTPTPPAQGL